MMVFLSGFIQIEKYMTDLNWEVEHGFFIFAITANILGYFGYYYFGHSTVMKKYFAQRFYGDAFWINWILFKKFSGFLFMAILPALFYAILFHGHPTDFGITIQHIMVNWKWLLIIPVVLVLINSLLARGSALMQQYPQMRISNWTGGRFLLSAIGWSAYLLAYEYLFRGLLLFSSYEAFGVWPAIAINVAIYSAVHIPKGMGETLGAIPFGILACVVTFSTGTILIAVIAHISLAVSMEYFTIKYNPDMYLITFKNKNKIQ
jgi:membrane protease YdiL (CAAX protease family)